MMKIYRCFPFQNRMRLNSAIVAYWMLLEALSSFIKRLKTSPGLAECSIFGGRKVLRQRKASKLFSDLIPMMLSLKQRRLEILRFAVEAPRYAHQSQSVCKAVENAATGRKAFGLLSFGKSSDKELFRQIKVEGRFPDSVEGWLKAKELLDYQKEVVSLASRWNAIAPVFDLPVEDPQEDIMGDWITEALSAAEQTKKTFQHYVKLVEKEIPVLFPHGIEPSDIIKSKFSAVRVREILKLNLSKNRLLRSRNSIDAILGRLVTCSGPSYRRYQIVFKKKGWRANGIDQRNSRTVAALDC